MIDCSHKAEVHAYADGVQSGTIPAGRLVRLSVERYFDDLENAESRGFYFNERWANFAIDFFPLLKHTTGEFAGQPFHLEPFQKFIVWNLWGWRRKQDDGRRFRWAFISLGRGNGKSPLSAGLANLLFIADPSPINGRPEQRAQVYAFATKEKQAQDIVFEEAKKQVESSPSIRRHVEILTKNMNIPQSGSKFEPKGSDSRNSDGWILHGAILDELHAWQERHRGLFAKIETAMGKRVQPLGIIVTTAGDDQSDIWLEQYEFCIKVLERTVDDDSQFAFIAEVDKEDDIFDEAVWPKANPMMLADPPPVKIDALRSLAAKAKSVPTAENTFRRFHCNQLTASFYRLIPKKLWDKGRRPLMPDLKGRACYLGFDWGWRNDLAALGFVFPRLEEQAEVEEGAKLTFDIFARCWIPEGCERNLSAQPWAGWIADGQLEVTSGDTTDVEAIYKAMDEATQDYEVRSVAYDPNNAREFSTKCVNHWGLETFPFFQTCRKYNEPTRALVDALQEGRIRHGGESLLAWCATNVEVKEDPYGYIMPSKSKSADKIDPMVAIIMGLSEALFANDLEGSVYENPGEMSW